jgi:hypothetical protein
LVSAPFARWDRFRAITEIARARTEEELDAALARCRDLAADQGRAEVAEAARRRRVELALEDGQAVPVWRHRAELEAARAQERRAVVQELLAAAVKLEEEARLARRRARNAAAAAAENDARLIRRMAGRIGGR